MCSVRTSTSKGCANIIKVIAKEKIGVALTEEIEQKTELHFEIWKDYEKQDPSKWLYQAY